MEEEPIREEIFAAVTSVSDTHFDSLTAEVSALEEIHQLLQERLSAAGS